jgi:hydrogenase maturation protein HypF
MIKKSINSPVSSSMGRLFDGVASLLGVRQEVQFEGQAAMEMEAMAWDAWHRKQLPAPNRYTATVISGKNKNKDNDNDSSMLIDHSPLVHWLCSDLANGSSRAELALWFHLWLVRSTLAMIKHLKNEHKHKKLFADTPILLGGGCFQNRMLMEFLRDRIDELKLQVYSGETVPVNDGGIALGQAFIGAKTGQKQKTEEIF